MSNQGSLFGPLLLIAAGSIWLLTASGNIPSANLWALTHIWPYILIAAGVGLILRAYWKYASLVMDVVIVGGAVLAIVIAPQLGWDNPSIAYIDGDNFDLGPSKRGSGNIVSETRDVSGFTSISVSYPAEIVITQGANESVKVEADDDLLPGLQTRVQGNELEIFYKTVDGKRVSPTEPVKISIVVMDLTNIDFSTAGKLTINGLDTDELDISVSGAGNVTLTEISASELSIDLSGAGNVDASGSADSLAISISGFGNFRGPDLHTKTADIRLSGAGNASVWVDDRLDAHISGAGSINYYGSPDVNKDISGIGNVSRSGDK